MKTISVIIISIFLIWVINQFIVKYFKNKYSRLDALEIERKYIKYTTGVMFMIFIICIALIFFVNYDVIKNKKSDKKIENINLTPEEEKTANKIYEELKSKYKTKEEIELLFSSWNGSLPSFVDYIKENMHNPDSFEHVKTEYRDDGDGLTVRMEYRGENGYGAIRTQTATVKTDYNGKILYLESNE